jgi:hypothetical protein
MRWEDQLEKTENKAGMASFKILHLSMCVGELKKTTKMSARAADIPTDMKLF